MGTIEFTVPAIGFLIGLEPRFQALDAPGLFESMENAAKVFADPDIRARLATFGESKGVEPLITFVNSPLGLLSHKPIRKVADFQGQKIRVPGGAPLHVEPFRKLGALPVSMPLGEVLPAMQNRAVDGLIGGVAVYPAFKYYDIAKGLTYLPGGFLVASGLVNRAFMKSLGAENEKIVREEARKHEALFGTWGIDDIKRIRATWEKNGGETIFLPPAEAKAYLDQVTSVIPAIVSANPKVKEDYEAFVAAAKKHR
jgi:C4-dicarboxylate-binding protein DctP